MDYQTAKQIVKALMERLSEELGEDEKFALSTLLYMAKKRAKDLAITSGERLLWPET